MGHVLVVSGHGYAWTQGAELGSGHRREAWLALRRMTIESRVDVELMVAIAAPSVIGYRPFKKRRTINDGC